MAVVGAPKPSTLLRLSYRLTTVPSHEFPSRSGFEIPLEPHRGFFFVELDTDQRSPRPKLRRVRRRAGVVDTQPRVRIGCHADILVGIVLALEDVHESLRCWHPLVEITNRTKAYWRGIWRERAHPAAASTSALRATADRSRRLRRTAFARNESEGW